MPDPIDGRPDDPRADAGCPECGSARVSFRIQRGGNRRRPMPDRSLIWGCRDCGTRWAGQLTRHPPNLCVEPEDPRW
jgi:hypothetical protein